LAWTCEGAAGHLHNLKSELVLLGVANFVAEDSFYELASVRKAGRRPESWRRPASIPRMNIL
jgi:hypothetical protein